jgi:hypothetical protein
VWSGRLPATKRGNTYYVDVMHLEGVAVEMGTNSIAPVPLGWVKLPAEVTRSMPGAPGSGDRTLHTVVDKLHMREKEHAQGEIS